MGTIAGNIATASPIGDTLPLLLSLDAKVVLQKKSKKTILPLKNFFISYRKTKLKKRQFIHSIIIPIFKKNIFKAYKISKRIDDDISSVCASFNLEINSKKIKNIKENPNSIFLSGGTDLSLNVTKERKDINNIISLNSVKELNFIKKKK